MKLTEELRTQASKRSAFDILFVGEEESRLSSHRGECMIREFSKFYAKHADISYMTVNYDKFAKLDASNLNGTNIIWLAGVSDYRVVSKIKAINDAIYTELNPNYKEELEALNKEDAPIFAELDALNESITEENGEDVTAKIKELTNTLKSKSFMDNLRDAKEEKVRIIYELDEFVWDGPVGRAQTMGSVLQIEELLAASDIIVAPNTTLIDAAKMYQLIPEDKNVTIIPTSASHNFFPIIKNMSKKGDIKKPNVLIKGVNIPSSVQDYMFGYYKQHNITLCSVSQVEDRTMAIIGQNKIKHIQHWANPSVHAGNRSITEAMERDMGYDIVIYCDFDEPTLYSISTGDEDILFAAASGTLPLLALGHIGYTAEDGLYTACPMFDPTKYTGRKIYEMVNYHSKGFAWNTAYNKIKALIEARISSAPGILGGYWQAMQGRKISEARKAMAEEKRAEIEAQANEAAEENVNEINNLPDNVLEGKFGQGE